LERALLWVSSAPAQEDLLLRKEQLLPSPTPIRGKSRGYAELKGTKRKAIRRKLGKGHKADSKHGFIHLHNLYLSICY
jgi:hypothetical protein